MISLGRNWLGGGFPTGPATSAAACSAAATAHAYIHRQAPLAGTVDAGAAVAGANVRVVSVGGAVACAAAVQVAPSRVDYAGFGAANAGANGAVAGRTDANAWCDAAATTLPTAEARRTARASLRARCQALGASEAQVYVLVSTSPAVATARAEGTTGHFAYVDVDVTAAATGEGRRAIPATAYAAAGAAASAGSRSDAVGAVAATAVAEGAWDPFIARGSVRYFDGNVRPEGVALLAATPYVYSVALAVGRCSVEVAAQLQTPGRVAARGQAEARGDTQAVIPFVGTVQVSAEAACSGVSSVAANGDTYPGNGVTVALAVAHTLAGAVGVVASTAVITPAQPELGVRPVPATPWASAVCGASRKTPAAVAVAASSSPRAANQINDLSHAPAWRTSAVGEHQALIVIPESNRIVSPTGTARSIAA